MLSAIIKSVIGGLTDKLFGSIEGIFESYFKKEITQAELKAKLSEALVKSATEIEVSHSETLAKTYDSFMKAVTANPILQWLFVVVAGSQLAVLLWHQVGISTLCYFVGNKACWPSSGTTADWAYLLLGGLCGLGPLVLRNGPGKMNHDQLKSLTDRK